jgi:hypothetical protein
MPNRLSSETSPYLLQHANNPVDWYPWGDEALQRAKDEDKPILLSIGYSACHWCHVMERESFEDEAIAALMNEHFVSIKVDREERPDIDKYYQNVHLLLNQRPGGCGAARTAAQAQEDRPIVADDGKSAAHGGINGGIIAEEVAGQQDRNCALGDIQKADQNAIFPAKRPGYIGAPRATAFD